MSNATGANNVTKSLDFSERVGTHAPEPSSIKRAKDILFCPGAVWPIIVVEEGGLKEALIPYTLVVGLIPMIIGSVLASTIWGVFNSLVGASMRVWSFPAVLFSNLHYFVYGLFGILALAKVVELVAPSFGLRQSWVLSTRVLVYASTPSYLVAVIGWLPVFGWLAVLAAFIWGLLLAYEGFKIVLKPENNATPSSRTKTEPVEPARS
jgi:hypothetical protein